MNRFKVGDLVWVRFPMDNHTWLFRANGIPLHGIIVEDRDTWYMHRYRVYFTNLNSFEWFDANEDELEYLDR